MSWRELAEAAVRPGGVVCFRYSVSTFRRWRLRRSSRSRNSRRRVPMRLSQIAFALGACGGLATILMPSAVNKASTEPVNWPAPVADQELDRSCSLPEVHQEVAGCLRGPLPSGRAVMPARRARRAPCSIRTSA